MVAMVAMVVNLGRRRMLTSSCFPRLVRRISTAKMELIVLGSGPSTSVPSIRCLLTNPECTVCPEAQANPTSKNRRGNPSLFIKHQGLHVLIDCGKTFRESLLRVTPEHHIHPIDAVILTHGHADACFGLDDLRDVQRKAASAGLEALPVYCSSRTRAEIEPKFSYLFDNESNSNSTSNLDTEDKPKLRWTAKLQWREFQDMAQFIIHNKMTVKTLPVWHGRDYVANGFEFGSEIGRRIVYISDVSQIMDETMEHLSQGAPVDILFIDALHTTQNHGTHMSLPQALEAIQLIMPSKAYLVGMSHSFDYEKHQPELQQLQKTLGIDVEMAYDGLKIDVQGRGEAQEISS